MAIGLTQNQMWDEALPFPCDACRVPVGRICRTRDGRPVTPGNGPHSARQARARGGYSWRVIKDRYDVLMPGPSPDGLIGE